MNPLVSVIELGRVAYREAYDIQLAHVEEVLAAREAGAPEPGRLLLVEHDPVITVSRRKTAPGHVVATRERLAAAGVDVQETDRGGDVTYHGPGQLVAYPILDLRLLGLGAHSYVRLLEQVIIDTLADVGLAGWRDEGATGVWVGDAPGAKIAAIGVRLRKWVSMHGLAINVDPDMTHFDLIVPCGLAGRGVTSLRAQLGDGRPTMPGVMQSLARHLNARVRERLTQADASDARVDGPEHAGRASPSDA